MPNCSSTAVLLLFFNRMDCLRIVLERLREIRPERLYLAADGPRQTRPEEASLCKQTRDMALEMINWQCCVKTLFRDHNLGCGRAVSEAISWFFENESEGIIIEDDCLLDTSFFRFAAEMLERYRNDERIALISALNIAGKAVNFDASYNFSRLLFGCWGWASWRRVWKDFDIDCNLLDTLEAKNELFFAQDYQERWFITTSLKGIREIGDYNTWDYQLTFACLLQSRLSIVPKTNLVQNLGDTPDGTHTPSRTLHNATRQAGNLDFPLLHPPYVMPNTNYDNFYKQNVMPKPPAFFHRLIKSLVKAVLPIKLQLSIKKHFHKG